MLNKFSSPATEGAYRAFLSALATFASVGLISYQTLYAHLLDPERLKESLIAGAIAALAPFVAVSAMGASDQHRADEDVVKPADVPVAAEGLVVRVAPPPVVE
jgi:hypothetical protein